MRGIRRWVQSVCRTHSTSVKSSFNIQDLRGSAYYSAYCGGATKYGISTANRFRPLKREQLQAEARH